MGRPLLHGRQHTLEMQATSCAAWQAWGIRSGAKLRLGLGEEPGVSSHAADEIKGGQG